MELPITVFVNLQLAFIALKLDRLLDFKWMETFWLVWVLMTFLVAITIGLLLACAFKLVFVLCYQSPVYQCSQM